MRLRFEFVIPCPHILEGSHFREVELTDYDYHVNSDGVWMTRELDIDLNCWVDSYIVDMDKANLKKVAPNYQPESLNLKLENFLIRYKRKHKLKKINELSSTHNQRVSNVSVGS